jgi:hypothetical protein
LLLLVLRLVMRVMRLVMRLVMAVLRLIPAAPDKSAKQESSRGFSLFNW